jgi:HK97 family phage major capsid protein
MKLDELRERLAVLNGQAQNIRKKADDERRDLTVEEASDLDGILAQFDRCTADVERLSRLEEQTESLYKPSGRKTEPDQPIQLQDQGDGTVTLTRQEPRREESRRVPATPISRPPSNWNFASLGDFALAVKRACLQKGGQWDERLVLSERLAAATIYGSEAVGSDGGFAVPPDFRTAVMTAVMGEESLLSRCDQIPVAGNSFTAPIDMTTPWQTSGGIQAYWGTEAGTKTQSKPALQDRTVKLNKIYALVPMTDELLEDAPAMDTYLRRKAPEKIRFAVDLAIVQGNGVGKPLGFLRSPAIVSVAKESGQVADTLIANNILKMYSRMFAPSRSRAVWLVNQDVEAQLFKLSIAGTDNTGNAVSGWGGMVYMPANGFSGSPFGTLFGRPVIPSQAMETLGDQGDIAFVDLSQYLALVKSGSNPKVDVSIHLWFDQDITAFRFVLRVGGMPWWEAAVSARDGSATYSPFVTLDERG